MEFSAIFVILTVFQVVYCQNGLFGFLNPRDIADLTQMAMQLTSQTVKSNQELMAKPGGPEVKPISSDLSPSEIFGQGLTNLMNPETAMKFLNNPQTRQPIQRGPTLPLERKQIVAEPMSELPNEFGRSNLFKPERLFSTLPRPRTNAAPSVDAAPLESVAEVGNTPIEVPKAPLPAPSQPTNLFGRGITPEMESSAGQLMKMATSFLRGAGGRGDSEGGYERNYDAPRYNQKEDLIPNIRDLMPGARENFGVKQGQGCLPFVGEFMQMAYGNCVKQADQKTFDAWGREFESVVTGRGINFFRASKETCKMMTEREQCGKLRRAVSSCDIINSIQIAMNMQRAIERCDQVSGIIDQNPATIVEGMSGLINGEVATGFLNNFLG